MSQCPYLQLKQFTLLFFLSWAFVVFFANQRQLVQHFANQILAENQVTSARTQKAKEFFEAHQTFQTQLNETQEEANQDQDTESARAALPTEINEDQSQIKTKKQQIIEEPLIIKQGPVPVQPSVEPVQQKQTPQSTPHQNPQSKVQQSSKPQQVKEVETTTQQKEQPSQMKANDDKRQKEAPKKPVKNQKGSKREEKKSEKQDKETKKERVASKQQKAERANREQKESQRTQKAGKKGQKKKKE